MSERRDVADAVPVLRDGTLALLGLLPNASNYTFLARADHPDGSVLVVYKPQAGERPLWDFPDGTLCRREVAAYEVSEMLGFGFVPPTVLRDGPHGVGSAQLFVDADPGEHYLTLGPEHDEVFRRVCAFDLVINNADRKSGHCLLEPGSKRIWVVDHGVSFHREDKLRTVIWDFQGEQIPADVRVACAALDERLDADPSPLDTLLDLEEIAALRLRARRLAAMEVFPEPGPGRPYPWPPV